jgi:phosphonate transport system ATP-binding protein
MLQIRNLVAAPSRKTAPVLNGVSLEVGRGEKVAILGPSGAGKTTLFRTITGFVPVLSGSITVNGVLAKGLRGKRLREWRRRIAMISQRHDLVDQLTVYQNVMAGALGRWTTLHALRFLLFPLAKEIDEATSALERVGIPQKLKAHTSDLSGGEHPRVALARALVQQPLVLLADEPVASLDPDLSEQILALLTRLAKENGFALICSLHQPQLAYDYFDRIIKIEHGKIVADERQRFGSPRTEVIA